MPHRMLVGILIQDGLYDHQSQRRGKDGSNVPLKEGNVTRNPAREEMIQFSSI
jgi:hypothetical protein